MKSIQSYFEAVGVSAARISAASIKQLRQLNADLLNGMYEINDVIKHESRAMTDDERTFMKGAGAHITEVASALRTRELEQDAERTMQPVADADADAAARAARAAGIPIAATDAGGASAPVRGRRYAELFPRAAVSMDGWRDSSEFLGVVNAGLADSRLHSTALDAGRPTMRATAGEFSDPGGGFAVPTMLAAQWLDSALQGEIVRPRCRPWPMASSDIKIPGWDETGAEELGGWTAEATDITPSTPAMKLISMRANKLGILVEVSMELLQDGVGYASQLDAKMIKHIGRHFDRGFLTGTGVGQPAGIVNSPATVVVAKEAGQVADTVVYQNITKMYSRLLPASMRRAVWIANPTTIPQLLVLTIPVGTGGAVVPVMTERDGKFFILGLEVLFTDLLPAVGDQGDILLADLSAYNVGMRSEMQLERSAHAGFSKATVYFRALVRADGQPGLTTPYVPDTGDTLSPFVTLAARA